MPLVTRTPLAWEMDHCDFTNRVSRGHVCTSNLWREGAAE
jgi:hypothetical protein